MGKTCNFSGTLRNCANDSAFVACTGAMVLRDDTMNDASQLATAMVAITFTAVLLITGQWFVDYRMQRLALEPATVIANLPR